MPRCHGTTTVVRMLGPPWDPTAPTNPREERVCAVSAFGFGTHRAGGQRNDFRPRRRVYFRSYPCTLPCCSPGSWSVVPIVLANRPVVHFRGLGPPSALCVPPAGPRGQTLGAESGHPWKRNPTPAPSAGWGVAASTHHPCGTEGRMLQASVEFWRAQGVRCSRTPALHASVVCR